MLDIFFKLWPNLCRYEFWPETATSRFSVMRYASERRWGCRTADRYACRLVHPIMMHLIYTPHSIPSTKFDMRRVLTPSTSKLCFLKIGAHYWYICIGLNRTMNNWTYLEMWPHFEFGVSHSSILRLTSFTTYFIYCRHITYINLTQNP